VRIVSWNVNSVRARLDHLVDMLDRLQPQVVALQETRCTDHQFPNDLFADRGYLVAHHGLHHRNGVAIASRVGLAHPRVGFRSGQLPLFDEARIISAECAGIRIHSIYVPNGRTLTNPQYTYKLDWLARLRDEVDRDVSEGVPVLVVGDFNVAPADIDIYNPSRFRRTTHASPPERAAIRAIEAAGLVDVHRTLNPQPGVYTWWSYAPGQFQRNHGMRIDLALAGAGVAQRVRGVSVDTVVRALPGASDHAPLVVDLT
jgi:exodeoxyribonuclease III